MDDEMMTQMETGTLVAFVEAPDTYRLGVMGLNSGANNSRLITFCGLPPQLCKATDLLLLGELAEKIRPMGWPSVLGQERQIEWAPNQLVRVRVSWVNYKAKLCLVATYMTISTWWSCKLADLREVKQL